MNPKFSALALAGVLANAAATKHPAFLKSKVNTKKISKRALGKAARKLDEENAFEITGEYSVNFNTCLHIKEDNEDLYDENYLAMTQNGELQAVKSMVLFDVCKTEYCSYEEDSNIHIVDLATWVTSLVDAPVQKAENYCEACKESEEVCYPEEEEEEEEEDESEEEESEEDEDEDEEESEEDEDEDEDESNDNEDRKKRKLANSDAVYVNCDTCETNGCFAEEADDAVVGDDDVVEWIQDLAECVQLDDQYNGLDIYAGLTCNGDGTGVTIGVFMDEDCTLLTNQASYKNYMDDDSNTLYSMSADLMMAPFIEYVSCEDIEYEALQNEEEEENEEEENEEEEQVEANESCKNLMESDYISEVGNCGDAEEENEDEDQDEENDYATTYGYSYDLTQEQVEEPQAVCEYITAFEGDYEGNNHNVNNEDEAEGPSYYDFSKYNRSKSVSGAIWIVVGVLAALTITVFSVTQCTKKSTDSKQESLMKDGQMA